MASFKSRRTGPRDKGNSPIQWCQVKILPYTFPATYNERTQEKANLRVTTPGGSVLKDRSQWRTVQSLTFCMFGLRQRTKKGLEELSVAIRECRESYQKRKKFMLIQSLSLLFFTFLSSVGIYQKQTDKKKTSIIEIFLFLIIFIIFNSNIKYITTDTKIISQYSTQTHLSLP